MNQNKINLAVVQLYRALGGGWQKPAQQSQARTDYQSIEPRESL